MPYKDQAARNDAVKRWRQKNPEVAKERARVFSARKYLENPEKVRAANRCSYRACRSRILQKQKVYRQAKRKNSLIFRLAEVVSIKLSNVDKKLGLPFAILV